MDDLVRANLQLPRMIARRYYWRWHQDPALHEDLVQDGMVGLLRARRLFDPERGVKFSTYAAFAVRAEMSLRYGLWRNERNPNLAGFYNSRRSRTDPLYRAPDYGHVESIQAREDMPEDRGPNALVSHAPSPHDVAARAQHDAIVAGIVRRAARTPTQQAIVELRLLTHDPRPQGELAALLGITPQGISDAEGKLMRTLQRKLAGLR